MATRKHFVLTTNQLTPVDSGGDGFIDQTEEGPAVYLFSASANILQAGRIAIRLLCDGPLKTANTAKVFVSHPLALVDTLEMVACQWILDNRPGDDHATIVKWLSGQGLRDFEARRMYDLFIRFCMWTAFKGVEIKFEQAQPELTLVQ